MVKVARIRARRVFGLGFCGTVVGGGVVVDVVLVEVVVAGTVVVVVVDGAVVIKGVVGRAPAVVGRTAGLSPTTRDPMAPRTRAPDATTSKPVCHRFVDFEDVEWRAIGGVPRDHGCELSPKSGALRSVAHEVPR
jgi:hypothetical protein